MTLALECAEIWPLDWREAHNDRTCERATATFAGNVFTIVRELDGGLHWSSPFGSTYHRAGGLLRCLLSAQQDTTYALRLPGIHVPKSILDEVHAILAPQGWTRHHNGAWVKGAWGKGAWWLFCSHEKGFRLHCGTICVNAIPFNSNVRSALKNLLDLPAWKETP